MSGENSSRGVGKGDRDRTKQKSLHMMMLGAQKRKSIDILLTRRQSLT